MTQSESPKTGGICFNSLHIATAGNMHTLTKLTLQDSYTGWAPKMTECTSNQYIISPKIKCSPQVLSTRKLAMDLSYIETELTLFSGFFADISCLDLYSNR